MPGTYTAIPSTFPPNGPTGLLKVIPSYLYEQYNDDNDLQAIFDATNNYQQKYVDAFNALNLPIYTGDIINTNLLDWVGAGIYGYPRPALYNGSEVWIGPFNSMQFDQTYPDEFGQIVKGVPTIADDDTYKRALTWHFYKGDGKYFDVQWLKRRVLRFLFGTNGTDPEINISAKRQVSVSFGPYKEVSIRFVLNVRAITIAAVPNNNGFQFNALHFNEVRTTYTRLPDLPFMNIFKQAVQAGSLELPFQYTFKVQIG